MLEDGTVDLVLGDETYSLKPTLSAMTAVNRVAGSLREAYDGAMNQNFDLICRIIIEGAGLDKRAARALPQKVYEAGMMQVFPVVVTYVAVLMNGGRPLDSVEDDGSDPDPSPVSPMLG